MQCQHVVCCSSLRGHKKWHIYRYISLYIEVFKYMQHHLQLTWCHEGTKFLYIIVNNAEDQWYSISIIHSWYNIDMKYHDRTQTNYKEQILHHDPYTCKRTRSMHAIREAKYIRYKRLAWRIMEFLFE